MSLRDRYSITHRLTLLVVGVGIGCAALALAMSQIWQRQGGHAAVNLREALAHARSELQQAEPAQREAVAGRWRQRGLQISRAAAMMPGPLPMPGTAAGGSPNPAFNPNFNPGFPPGAMPAPAAASAPGIAAGMAGNPALPVPPAASAANPAMPRTPGTDPSGRPWPPTSASGVPMDRPMPPMGGVARSSELQAIWPIGNELWTVELAEPAADAWRAWLPTVGALVLLVLGSMLASAVAVRWITRPITRLAHQLYEQRQHLRPIQPRGLVSVELQEIIAAFNSLVQALQATEDTRRHMLAGLSHDLRTPLARLKLRTEIELGEEVSDKMTADFDALGRIIDQFIIYTQSEAALVWDEPEMLDDLVSLTVDRYDPSRVQVTQMSPHAAQVRLPALPIDRAIGNLIDNALAYGATPVQVEVDVRDGLCAIWVYDHGRGVPAGMLQTALQPFVRLRSDTGSSGHCGLGLAIVAQVARQFEGRVVHHAYDGRRSGLGLAFPVPSRERLIAAA